MLCARAKYRVAMDADVSADGAVRDFLWSVAPQFDLLHVQLRQAALSREVHYGFTESKRDTLITKQRQRLALHRARESREKAMAGPEGQQLQQATLAVIRSWVRVKRRCVGEDPAELQLPFRDLGASVRDAPRPSGGRSPSAWCGVRTARRRATVCRVSANCSRSRWLRWRWMRHANASLG